MKTCHIVLDGYHAQLSHIHVCGSPLTAETARSIRNAALSICHRLGAPHFDDKNIVASFHGGCAAPGMPRGLAVMTEDYAKAILDGAKTASRLAPMEMHLSPLVVTAAGYRQSASVDRDIQARIGDARAGDWVVVLTPDRHHAAAIEAAVARGVEVVLVVCDDPRQFYSRRLVAAVGADRAYKLQFEEGVALAPLAA